MGKKLDIGVNNVARKGKKGWLGVDDVAHKIKKMWVGDDNGKARLFFRDGLPLYLALVADNGRYYLALGNHEKVRLLKKASTTKFVSIAYGDGKLFAGEYHNGESYRGTYHYSTDVINWTKTRNSNLHPVTGTQNACFVDGVFYVFLGSTSVYISTDLLTWTKKGTMSGRAGSPAKLEQVIYFGGYFFARTSYDVSYQVYGEVLYSKDGLSWTRLVEMLVSPICNIVPLSVDSSGAVWIALQEGQMEGYTGNKYYDYCYKITDKTIELCGSLEYSTDSSYYSFVRRGCCGKNKYVSIWGGWQRNICVLERNADGSWDFSTDKALMIGWKDVIGKTTPEEIYSDILFIGDTFIIPTDRSITDERHSFYSNDGISWTLGKAQSYDPIDGTADSYGFQIADHTAIDIGEMYTDEIGVLLE